MQARLLRKPDPCPPGISQGPADWDLYERYLSDFFYSLAHPGAIETARMSRRWQIGQRAIARAYYLTLPHAGNRCAWAGG